ncbi:hypothetical protein INS49_007929 [Diaporthe citri]|uniref:uncharacterized protein n=1 Tax=Diaporthe citri TaxID=83186 RepID=UPI001C7F9444|nr:uncharacterized protein INS49_007929 [Diaporthe citri]KAG6362835.1 hypothetical protein INS49_007929 [Diaporthe citri]
MGSKQADVLIIGAGPVGLFTALRLGQSGVKVVVIERDPAVLQLPRSCGYYPIVQFAFHHAGIYNAILQRGGFLTTGMDFRRNPTDDGKGGKKAGELVGGMPTKETIDTNGPPGTGTLNMPQPILCQILLEEVTKLDAVSVCFDTELVGIHDEEGSQYVTAETRNVTTGDKKTFSDQYLVGADGGKSKTRGLLGIPFSGHTWPEKLLATDVWLMNYDESPITTTYLLDPVHYTVITPLTRPVTGEKSMWRIAFALDPDETRSNEELLSDEHIYSHYDRIWPGPRPLPFQIENRTTYVIHQRLAATMKRGRCVLAGDAAHLVNPMGALGLNTGFLDAVALSDALKMVLKEGKPAERVLQIYSDERRKVVQEFADPTSIYNNLRLHSVNIQTAHKDDWFFRSLQDYSSEDFGRYWGRFQHTWPTGMRALVDKSG